MSRLFYLHLFLVWLVDTTRADATGLPGKQTEYGPIITVQPQNTIYDTETVRIPHVVMNCEADANPVASYVWYVERELAIRLVNLSNPNITVTNGSLIIEQPSDTLHNGDYQCVASNIFGSVLSNKAQLSFGYLDDFPKTRRDPVVARAWTGIAIECIPPKTGYDDLSYSWYKDTVDKPVPINVQWYIFVSKDGKLYFQFVTKDDEGGYYCVVKRPNTTDNFDGGKTSMPIPLQVMVTMGSEQSPLIVNSFPKSFPSSPMAGEDVRLECVAFATTVIQLEYVWNRTDEKPMPSNASFSDYNRVMTIPNIQLSDAGRYRCSARRQGDDAITYGELLLSVEANPFFALPLRDMNVEENSTVQWMCIANEVPAITYGWYVNATIINDTLMMPENRERFQLVDNVLTITNVQQLDAGMYQCSATNAHGQRFSSAQLRVISATTTRLPTITQISSTASTIGAHTSTAAINPTTTTSCSPGSVTPGCPTGGIVIGNSDTTAADKGGSGTISAQGGVSTKNADGTTTNRSGLKFSSSSSVSEGFLNTTSPSASRNSSSKYVMDWTLLLLILFWHSRGVLSGLVVDDTRI